MSKPPVSRRAVTRGAVWSVPAITLAAAAPAYAASVCSTQGSGTVNFAAGGNYTRTSTTVGKATVSMTIGSPMVVDFVSTTSANYVVDPGNLVGAGSGLTLSQKRSNTSAAPSEGQKLTITFTRDVYNLAFSLRQFSWPNGSNSPWDAAWVTPTPVTPANTGGLIGAGTSADPFRNSVQGDSAVGATAFTYAGPIRTLTVQFFDRSAATTPQQQSITIPNFSFQAC